MRFVFLAALGISAALVLPAQQPVGNVPDSYPFRAAEPSSSLRIARLRADINVNPAAVEQFWDEMRRDGAPIIEPLAGDDTHSRVTFVWRGSVAANNVVITDGVAVGVGGVDPINSQMTRIPGTDVWYRTYDIRNDARFTYALSENDPLALFTDDNRKSNSKPDPLNPRKFLTGQSYVELRDAPPQPWTVPRSPDMSGHLEQIAFTGSSPDRERRVWVYTPRGFQASGERYPLLVALGGASYTTFIPVPVILDNLIAEGRIPPVVAVMVGFSPAEATCSPAFSRFLAGDVVPWMRKTYYATDKAVATVIGGSSLGALASACTALNHSDVFGKVLSQSGSFWWNRVFGSRTVPDDVTDAERLTRQISIMPARPVEFFLEVGRMEASEVQLNPNRHMRDVLRAKGYPVHYQEFNGNHNYVNWRGSFGEGVAALLGRPLF